MKIPKGLTAFLEKGKPRIFGDAGHREMGMAGGLMSAVAKALEDAQAIERIKQNDLPLEEAYGPGELIAAIATGGGGVGAKALSGALDPVASWVSENIPIDPGNMRREVDRADQTLMEALASQAQDPSNTLVAHIMPEEAKALARKNGGGSINPVTGLPEFWNDSDSDDDGDGYSTHDGRSTLGGGYRDASGRGYGESYGWGGGDDSGGWGGMGDAIGALGREIGGSVGSYSDGLSNVDATRAKEAMADMRDEPDKLADVVNRAAINEILSDDQQRQARVKDMWGGATSFRDYPNETRLERAWNKLTRADNVLAGAFGLLGSLAPVPGLGMAASKLGGWLGKDLTPAATVANLGRTRGDVPTGYAAMDGTWDRPDNPGMSFAGGMGSFAEADRPGGNSVDRGKFPVWEGDKVESLEEKKKRDESEKKQKDMMTAIISRMFSDEDAPKEGKNGTDKDAQALASTPWWLNGGFGVIS